MQANVLSKRVPASILEVIAFKNQDKFTRDWEKLNGKRRSD